MSQDKKPEFVEMKLDNLSDSQMFMLKVILNEGAMSERERIIAAFQTEDSVCSDWALTVINNMEPPHEF